MNVLTVIRSAGGMVKKADTGNTYQPWRIGPQGAGGFRPAQPKQPNVNVPQARYQTTAGKMMNPYEASRVGAQTGMDSYYNNQSSVAAAKAKENADKGMFGNVDSSGYFENGRYIDPQARKESRRALRGSVGWWDRMVSRVGGSDAATAREVRRGNAIDTRSGWEQFKNFFGFGRKASDANNYYRVGAVGQYRAPNGMLVDEAQYDKKTGDMPNQQSSLVRDINGRNNLTYADVQYDNQQRANNLIKYYRLGDSEATRYGMQGLLRDISDSRNDESMWDAKKKQWTDAARQRWANDERFKQMWDTTSFMNDGKLDRSAFLDSVMGEAGNSYRMG